LVWLTGQKGRDPVKTVTQNAPPVRENRGGNLRERGLGDVREGGREEKMSGGGGGGGGTIKKEKIGKGA